jgi:hypothetical protein
MFPPTATAACTRPETGYRIFLQGSDMATFDFCEQQKTNHSSMSLTNPFQQLNLKLTLKLSLVFISFALLCFALLCSAMLC